MKKIRIPDRDRTFGGSSDTFPELWGGLRGYYPTEGHRRGETGGKSEPKAGGGVKITWFRPA